MLEQMDSRWFHVFSCLCFASNVVFKDPIINFRGTQARFFQQLNIGFGKGSSGQTRQGGLGWPGRHKWTRGGGMGKETRRGQRRDILHAFPVPLPQLENAREGI